MMMELFDDQEVLRSYVQSEKHDAVKEAAKDLREAVHPVTRLLLYRIYHILALIANTTSRFPAFIFHSSLNTDFTKDADIEIFSEDDNEKRTGFLVAAPDVLTMPAVAVPDFPTVSRCSPHR